MGIISIDTDVTGESGIHPRCVKIISSDNLETVTAAGYLNLINTQGNAIFNTDYICMWYGASATQSGISNPGTFGFFIPSISNGTITLSQDVSDGNVLLPVVDEHIAAFNGTTGQIYSPTGTVINSGSIQAGLSGTAGSLISYPPTAAKGSLKLTGVANTGDTVTTISNAAMGQASVVSIPDPGVATTNFLLSDSAGTQTISTGSLTLTAGAITTTAGNITAGSSGNAGTLASLPGTASRGSLILAAVNNTGNTNTTISNAAMGQASVVSIPDPAAATANFVVAPAALVSGNVVKASGTAGLVVDAGFAVHAGTTAAYAGGGTSNAFVTTNMTASSIVAAVILASTNAVSIAKAVPGTNTLTVTFSADPGADTTVSWISITPAVA
jgi:hypothetical protein